jgi:hypothetical protein
LSAVYCFKATAEEIRKAFAVEELKKDIIVKF